MLSASLALLLADPAALTGDWVTADRSAIVRIAPCATGLCGRIVRILAQGAPRSDVNNPDHTMRRRPLVGIAVLSGFGADGGGSGLAYDPKSGRSYRARLRAAADGTLRVTGCVAIICRTQTWTRPR